MGQSATRFDGYSRCLMVSRALIARSLGLYSGIDKSDRMVSDTSVYYFILCFFFPLKTKALPMYNINIIEHHMFVMFLFACSVFCLCMN